MTRGLSLARTRTLFLTANISTCHWHRYIWPLHQIAQAMDRCTGVHSSLRSWILHARQFICIHDQFVQTPKRGDWWRDQSSKSVFSFSISLLTLPVGRRGWVRLTVGGSLVQPIRHFLTLLMSVWKGEKDSTWQNIPKDHINLRAGKSLETARTALNAIANLSCVLFPI